MYPSFRILSLPSIALAVVAWASPATAQTLNYSEDFESFSLGTVNGQNGWTSDDPERVSVGDSGLAGFGSKSLILQPVNGATGLSSLDLAVSPEAWTATEGRFEADVVISSFGYEYEFGLEQGGIIWNARLRMANNGQILLMSQSNGLLIWNQTGASWTPGVPFRLGLEIEDFTRVRAYKDGAAIGTSVILSPSVPPGMTAFAVRQSWPGASGSGTVMVLDNIVFDTCPLPVDYCPPTANSNSPTGATLYYTGSRYMSANDGQLGVFQAPAAVPCVFLASATQAQLPFGNGTLCLGAPRKRLGPTQTTTAANLPFSSGGRVFRNLDLTTGPLTQVTPGSTWNFQLWFRDNAGGGAGTNLSSAVSVTYCP